MTKGQLAMAVAMIYPEPEKSAARNSLLAIASAATCRTSSSEKRPRGFSIAPTRSRKTERRSTGTACAAVMMICNCWSVRETIYFFPRQPVRHRTAVLWRIVQPLFRWRPVICRDPCITFGQSDFQIVPVDAAFNGNDGGSTVRAWLARSHGGTGRAAG
jgi:hypothetical protein